MIDKAILTECYVDSNLIETLIPTKIGYNKQHGCSRVAGVMKKQLKDKFALGIIDKDKTDIDYLKEFDKIDEVEHSLILWKHKEKHHYIIQISPEVEPWLLNVAKELNINLNDFGLPTELSDLYKYAKKQSSKSNPDFKRLFGAMRGTDHVVIKKLIHWVSYLKEKNYKADIKELTNV